MSQPLSLQWRLKKFLHNGFVAPFATRERFLLYLRSFMGCFGFSGATTYIAFDFAGIGLMTILVFFVSRFAMTGYILMPGTLYLLHRLPMLTAGLVMMGVQVAMMALIVAKPEFVQGGTIPLTLLASAIFGLLSAPFWSTFHYSLVCHTSEHNRGNEVSIAGIASFSGGTVGVLASGFALSYMPGVLFLVACGLTQMAAVLLATVTERGLDTSPAKNRPFHLLGGMRKEASRSVTTMMEGAFQLLTGFAMPVWLWALGTGSVLMGFLSSLQGLIKFIISPFAGYLFHENKARDIVMGSTIKALGWLPWIIIQAPWVMALSSLLWTLGGHMHSVGLGSRWYGDQSLAAQAVREMMLATGRILCALITLPVLYVFGLVPFFAAALLFGCGTILASMWIRSDERRDRISS